MWQLRTEVGQSLASSGHRCLDGGDGKRSTLGQEDIGGEGKWGRKVKSLRVLS